MQINDAILILQCKVNPDNMIETYLLRRVWATVKVNHDFPLNPKNTTDPNILFILDL